MYWFVIRKRGEVIPPARAVDTLGTMAYDVPFRSLLAAYRQIRAGQIGRLSGTLLNSRNGRNGTFSIRRGIGFGYYVTWTQKDSIWQKAGMSGPLTTEWLVLPVQEHEKPVSLRELLGLTA